MVDKTQPLDAVTTGLEEKESPLLSLGGTGGKQECSDSFQGHSLPFESLSSIPGSLQTAVQALLCRVSALRSSRAAEQKGTLEVFSSTCFQTVSNADGRVSRKGVEQPAKLAHLFVLLHLQILPFTPFVRSGVEEQLIIIF